MTALSYEIDSEFHSNALYLKVILNDGQKSGFLSPDKILSYAQKSKEKEALEMLVLEERRFRERFSKDKAHPFQICHVSKERAFELLKMLAVTGRLQWNGQKIVVDPFTEMEILVEAEKDKDTLLLTGKWRSKQQSGAIGECQWIFPAGNAVGWILKNRILYPLKGSSHRQWVDWIYPQSTTFAGSDAVRFLKELEDEDLPDPPEIVWIGASPFSSKSDVEPLPFLLLHDRHGAFADLWFDYGAFGQVAAHDSAKAFWRNLQSEKNWEKDLLETDFIKKTIDASHYYCPLDKVSKSLTFILDIGWKIFDHRKREVLRQKRQEMHTEMSAQHILIRGKVHYDDHNIDLKDLVGAFNRREKFIDLSPSAVGLLDPADGQKYEGLALHEVIGDAIAVKKYQVGMLASLFEAKEQSQDYAELFRFLPDGWRMATADVSSAFQGQLFAYQQEGLKWLSFLWEGQCGGLLADEMGLGKTVQVVAFFSQLQRVKPCLIVVPTSLLFNWQREFERFLPSCPIYVHSGKTREKNEELYCRGARIIITSYSLLRLDDWLQKIDYQVVVLDEAQTIKNPESQIAKIAFSLRAQMRLAVTGTPIENRLQDLWSLFHFLLPGLLGERNEFHAKIGAAGSDVRYLEQVKRKVRPFLLRRKKQGVGLQLPPKMEQLIFVDMAEEQRSLYEHWLAHTKAGLIKKVSLDGASAHRMEILEAILRLRQLCVHPWLVDKGAQGDLFSLSGKCERLFLDLQEVIEEGKKVIIYSQFSTMLHLIRREVANKEWSYVYLDGSTTDRETVVKQFQEDPKVSIFLISLKAGGVGLNLTAADYVFLFDPWWNEAVEQQAIDRAHRMGRSQTVIARRYITALSIEEKIMHLKKHKLGLVQGLFDEGGDMSGLTLDDLMQLIVE